jgi:hypothetical protein
LKSNEFLADSDTLFGSLKEFSSMRLLDVRTVFVDPSDWNVFRFIPSIEIFRFTMLIWKTRYLAQINEDVSEIPNQIRSLRQLKSAGLESLLLQLPNIIGQVNILSTLH